MPDAATRGDPSAATRVDPSLCREHGAFDNDCCGVEGTTSCADNAKKVNKGVCFDLYVPAGNLCVLRSLIMRLRTLCMPASVPPVLILVTTSPPAVGS